MGRELHSTGDTLEHSWQGTPLNLEVHLDLPDMELHSTFRVHLQHTCTFWVGNSIPPETHLYFQATNSTQPSGYTWTFQAGNSIQPRGYTCSRRKFEAISEQWVSKIRAPDGSVAQGIWSQTTASPYLVCNSPFHGGKLENCPCSGKHRDPNGYIGC